jgi:hypothetical protein
VKRPRKLAGLTTRLFWAWIGVLASLNHPQIAAIDGLEEGPAEAGPYENYARDYTPRLAGGTMPFSRR